MVVLLAGDLVEDVADDGARDGADETLLDLDDGLAALGDDPAAFLGSTRHITLTSMWTLLPSLVLNVMSSGTGRSPSGRVGVHQQVLLRDGQDVPGVEDRQEEVDAARRVDLLLAALLEDAEQAGPHADLGGGGGAAANERAVRRERPPRPWPGRSLLLLLRREQRGAAPPGSTPMRAQALRTKAMYCSGVITAPSMFSNILAVSRATT